MRRVWVRMCVCVDDGEGREGIGTANVGLVAEERRWRCAEQSGDTCPGMGVCGPICGHWPATRIKLKPHMSETTVPTIISSYS